VPKVLRYGTRSRVRYLYLYTLVVYGTKVEKYIRQSVSFYISISIYIYIYIYTYTPILYVMPYIMYGYITNGYDNNRSPDAILGNDTRERAKILTWLIARTRHGPNSIYSSALCVYDIIILIQRMLSGRIFYNINVLLARILPLLLYCYYILTHERKKKNKRTIYFLFIFLHNIRNISLCGTYLRIVIIICVRHIYIYIRFICNVYMYI